MVRYISLKMFILFSIHSILYSFYFLFYVYSILYFLFLIPCSFYSLFFLLFILCSFYFLFPILSILYPIEILFSIHSLFILLRTLSTFAATDTLHILIRQTVKSCYRMPLHRQIIMNWTAMEITIHCSCHYNTDIWIIFTWDSSITYNKKMNYNILD